jgi:hypothetical protein
LLPFLREWACQPAVLGDCLACQDGFQRFGWIKLRLHAVLLRLPLKPCAGF